MADHEKNPETPNSLDVITSNLTDRAIAAAEFSQRQKDQYREITDIYQDFYTIVADPKDHPENIYSVKSIYIPKKGNGETKLDYNNGHQNNFQGVSFKYNNVNIFIGLNPGDNFRTDSSIIVEMTKSAGEDSSVHNTYRIENRYAGNSSFQKEIFIWDESSDRQTELKFGEYITQQNLNLLSVVLTEAQNRFLPKYNPKTLFKA